MAGLSRAQLAVYGAVAVALLLIGVRAVRGETAGEPFAAAPDSGGGPGGFELSSSGGGGDVVVDVTGAVRRPGVYRLPSGSRVIDAVQRAGGAGPKGLLEAVNLAARLADGQQIVIPETAPGGASAAGATATSGPISLGTATAAQLATIDGIGPVTARDIIEFRDQHGGLASVEQLDEVSGIGPATMQSLREGLQP